MTRKSRSRGIGTLVGKIADLRALLVIGALALIISVFLGLGATTVFAMGAQHDTADVVPHLIGGEPQVECDGGVCGASTLVRNSNGVSFTIDTSFLGDQHAFTVWMLVDDFGTTDAERGGYEIALRVDGGISQKDGDGHFAGHLSSGELPPVDIVPPKNVLRTGDGSFDDPWNSKIRLVLRDHGPKLPGHIFEQTNFVNGGCNPTCVSIQETIHMP